MSVPLMARQDPWGFYSSQHHFCNQLVALKGEAIFAFVFEMRVHGAHQEVSGHLQAEKEELISSGLSGKAALLMNHHGSQ